ncbi:enoyl-CoA hydratase/isomerase family protein, partial [Variovorax sp. CT11-76]
RHPAGAHFSGRHQLVDQPDAQRLLAADAAPGVEQQRGLAEAVAAANRHERELQCVQFASEDFKEGVQAMAERRAPRFLRR